jgi:hypothetical protein
VRAWFAVIVANECRNHRRREGRLRARHLRAAPPVTTTTEDPDLEGLGRAMAELPDHERRAVALHHLAGYGIPATAATLGCSERTARTWIASGLSRLRRRLGAAVVLIALGAAAQGAEPGPGLVAATRAAAAARRPRRTGWWIAAAGAALVLVAAGAVVVRVTTADHRTDHGGADAMPPPPAVAASDRTAVPVPAAAVPSALRPALPPPGPVDGATADDGPPLRWLGRRPGDSDRRLLVLAHYGTDEAEARAILEALGRGLLPRGWTVVVAWRPGDRDGSHPRPGDALRLVAALDRQAAMPAPRTVLAGVSFGGDSALAAGVSGLVPVAGVVAWPGRAPARTGATIPVLIIGSRSDDLGWGPDLVSGAERLRRAGVPVDLRLGDGVDHVPDLDDAVLAGWLDGIVPRTLTGAADPAAARRRIAGGGDADIVSALRISVPGRPRRTFPCSPAACGGPRTTGPGWPLGRRSTAFVFGPRSVPPPVRIPGRPWSSSSPVGPSSGGRRR